MLDDEDGTFAPVAAERLSCAVAGAVLLDLAFAHRIDTDRKALFVIDPAPTGNPILDRTLARLANHELGANTRTWIRVLSVEDAIGIRERALESLVERRILERRDKRFLWSFRSRRYPIVDGRAEREVKLRIRNVLFSEEIPDPRDVALIGLADACHLFDDVFLDRDIEQWRPRIDQLKKMDLIGRELAGAITDIERTVMTALSVTP